MVSVFHHTDTTYQELTLEFLVTFELERGIINVHRVDTVQFSMWLGLYDEAFTQTQEYDALLIMHPLVESLESY